MKKNDELTPNDILKYEVAEELGLMDKVNESGWKSLTAKESGKIGGIMTKRKRELKKNE
jgi:small acid-soluble spore protein F (minor alpha/beta-type SASP)